MVIKRPTLRHISWVLGGSLLLCGLFWLWLTVQQQESTLAIRPVSQGISMPDGFSVWHHLDANGIRFKSITPQNDGLLIKFDSNAQGVDFAPARYPTQIRVINENSEYFHPVW